MGSDVGEVSKYATKENISIHAPRVGSDFTNMEFMRVKCYFNPRSPCGERPLEKLGIFPDEIISIHAPRVGSDSHKISAKSVFLISIHAPRVGSDIRLRWDFYCTLISIHAPRVGSDQLCSKSTMRRRLFQSTLPVWGATVDFKERLAQLAISIHAPRVGSDRICAALC